MTISIKLANNSGFCFGVKRAMEMARRALAKGGEIYSYGPLIHNPQEIEILSREGVHVVHTPEDVPAGSYFIIRSHGAGPQILERAAGRNLRIIDATCPLVKRAQNKAQFLYKSRFDIVVVGQRTHPEVEAILSYAPNAVVIESEEEAGQYTTPSGRVGVIAQTTQSPESYRRILGVLLTKKFFEMTVFNTICDATVNRQEAALEVARHVDVMFVLGGHNSANTARLAQMCRESGVQTYHLETHKELEENSLRGKHAIGVTAGASTPDWVVEEFIEQLKRILKERFNEQSLVQVP